jgi:hypothetical protein
MSLQFTVTLDEAEVDAIIQRATEEVRALATKSLTAQLIAPMVKERIVPKAVEPPVKQEGMPVITWEAFYDRIKSQSVATAALLDHKVYILRYGVDLYLDLTMPRPIAEQFIRQQAKANLLIRVAREFLGKGTKVTIFIVDNESREHKYAELQLLDIPAQAVAKPKELKIFCDLFNWFKHGAWKLKPGEIIYTSDGDHAPVKAVKYCCVTTYAGQKVAPLFWLPRTPDLCYLDFNALGVKEKLEPNPAAVRREWRKAGLLDDADKLTTRNMSIRGKVKRLVPIKIEALKALGIDTSWACEP